VADAPPPPPPPAGAPVAIRITRPYESEDEYLAQELEMVSKTSITLVGAQPRPQGVVLRFELVLTKGTVLVRGEGRVVAFKPNAYKGVGGLTLRFTRIDAKSKALLDKATSMREQRRPSSKPPKEPAPTEPTPAPPPPPPRRALSAPPPAPRGLSAPPPPPRPAPVPIAEPSGVSIPIDLADELEAIPPALAPAPPLPVPIAEPSGVSIPIDLADELEPDEPAAAAAPAPGPAQPPQPTAPELGDVGVPAKPPESRAGAAASPTPAKPPSKLGVDTHPERDSLLERLRARAKGLGADGVRRILDQKPNGTG
jgi:hypothetical protein